MFKEVEIIETITDNIVILRRLTKNDAKFFYDSLRNKKITHYLSLGPLHSLDHAKRLIKNYLKYWDRYKQFNYVILKGKIKLGSISLWNVSWLHKRAEVGIWLLPHFWNKGYGTKSIQLIKNIAFNHLLLNRLEAHIASTNVNSIKMFESCGFQEEGLLKQYLNLNGVFYDAKVLSHLKNTRILPNV